MVISKPKRIRIRIQIIIGIIVGGIIVRFRLHSRQESPREAAGTVAATAAAWTCGLGPFVQLPMAELLGHLDGQLVAVVAVGPPTAPHLGRSPTRPLRDGCWRRTTVLWTPRRGRRRVAATARVASERMPMSPMGGPSLVERVARVASCAGSLQRPAGPLQRAAVSLQRPVGSLQRPAGSLQ